MAQQVKELKVRLNGEVGKGISSISNSLSQMGALLDQIGGKSREFQKESLEIYRGYEDNMLAAKFALSSQYTSATQLSRVMDTLHDSAQTWAASTIFHTDDVSQAINEAAHAGWSLEEIMEGVPDAMKIAQAGGLDLSTGLDYLIKMANSTGTEFGDMGTLIDQWAMAANSSATNIQELGEAFLSMGSAAQFGDSTAELFTLLGVLADVGTVGSQAGTALRSAMVRLIAPTTKAENAMDLLGADAEELEEVLSNTNVTKAVKMLEGLGWSAYENGKLKSIKDIFGELFQVTESLDEASRNEIISAIFPTRTIATALALMTASGEKIDELYAKISNSEGYASKGADIMMSGVTGSVETLNSKWEEFKRRFGETLTPGVESVADSLSGMLDKLNSADEATMNGLTGMAVSLGAAGPIMMGTGAIIKMLGALGVYGTAALLAAGATGYLVGYVTKLNEQKFDSHFGDLALDVEKLGEAMDGMTTKFDTEKAAMQEWSEKAAATQEEYKAALTFFSENTLTEVLVGGKFTKADYDALEEQGKNVGDAVLKGIKTAKESDQTFMMTLFGDPQNADDATALAEGVLLSEAYWDATYKEAQQIGENIRDRLTSALNNGELTTEDRQAIQKQIDRYNKIMAEIEAGKAQAEYYAQLAAASRVSHESIDEFLSENETKRTAAIAAIHTTYNQYEGNARQQWEWARENGFTEFEVDGVKYQLEDVDRFEDTKLYQALDRQRAASVEDTNRKFSGVATTAVENLLLDSDAGAAWAVLIDAFKRNPSMQAENGGTDFLSLFGGMTREQVQGLVEPFTNLIETNDYYQRLLNPYVQAGDDTAYAMMAALQTMKATGGNLAQNALEYVDYGGEGYQWGENGLELPVTVAVDDTAAQEYEPPEYTATLRITPYVGSVQASGIGGYSGLTGRTGSRLSMLEENLLYAEGGRATEASVFGEAGPEWAIPEKHDDRTAELLNAAREASGFTWGDLIDRNGGLNSRPGGNSVVVHYSPVINAGDANGVASVLSADKDRLIRMLKDAMDEMKYRDSVEVFA